MHITLGRIRWTDFGYSSPIRMLFDGLSIVLGGSPTRPGDLRIADLRVSQNTDAATTAEIRIWRIDD